MISSATSSVSLRLCALLVIVAGAWPAIAGSASPAGASGKSLNGRWSIRIVQPATGCDWVGEVRLDQSAAVLTGHGSAAATKDSRGASRCPPLKGEVHGSVRGEIVRFGFATGRLGKAEFEGRIAKKGMEMQGSWTTRSAAGQWAAAR